MKKIKKRYVVVRNPDCWRPEIVYSGPSLKQAERAFKLDGRDMGGNMQLKEEKILKESSFN